jgi:hypothetical protein
MSIYTDSVPNTSGKSRTLFVAKILHNTSESNIIYLGDSLSVIGIQMSPGWSVAAMIFWVSQDTIRWNNVAYTNGAVYSIPAPVVNSCYSFNISVFQPYKFFRINSGLAATNQAQDRIITVIARSISKCPF